MAAGGAPAPAEAIFDAGVIFDYREGAAPPETMLYVVGAGRDLAAALAP